MGNFKIMIAANGIEGGSLTDGPSEMSTLAAELKQVKMPIALPPGSHGRLFRYGTVYCFSGTSTCEFRLWPPINIVATATQ
jgi:hypothetical protein